MKIRSFEEMQSPYKRQRDIDISEESSGINIAFIGKDEYNFTALAIKNYFYEFMQMNSHTIAIELEKCHNIKDIFNKLNIKQVDYAVIPLESSSFGTIHHIYDQLLNHCQEIAIVGEIGSLEEYCLCVKDYHHDLKIDGIIGHPHLLDCCSDYIDNLEIELSKSLIRRASWDSSAACEEITNSNDSNVYAAIGSKESALKHNLNIIKSNIGNDQNAETRYVILAKKQNQVFDKLNLSLTKLNEKQTRKASIALALRNVKGAIFKMSSCFALRDIDIIKIESRPASTLIKMSNQESSLFDSNKQMSRAFTERHWDLIFYIDYEPSSNNEVQLALLNNLREYALWICELGNYSSGLKMIPVKHIDWKNMMDVVSIA